jgi:hypothetical protein
MDLGTLVIKLSVIGIEAHRLVVVRDGAVVLTSTEASISGIEKGHREVGL